MAKLTAAQKKQIQSIVDNFELDPNGTSDYRNMEAKLIEIGLKPKNDFIWYCINNVPAETYEMDFLD